MALSFARQKSDLEELRRVLKTLDSTAQIIAKIAKLADENADEIAAELIRARQKFEGEWMAARPAVPVSMYPLLGPRPEPGFDLVDLATGGRDLIGSEGFERLEPVIDEPSPTSPGTP